MWQLSPLKQPDAMSLFLKLTKHEITASEWFELLKQDLEFPVEKLGLKDFYGNWSSLTYF